MVSKTKRRYFQSETQREANALRLREKRRLEREALEKRYKSQLERMRQLTRVAELSAASLASFRDEYDFEAFIQSLRKRGYGREE